MAAPVTSGATFNAGSPELTYPSVVNGEWVRVVTNTTAGAVAAAVLLNPRIYSSNPVAANHCPLLVNMGTRIRFIGRYDATAIWTVWTSPSVRVFGADKTPDSTGAYPAGTIFWRLDDTTFNAASTTVTLAYPNDQRDGDRYYGTPISNDGYLLRGAKSVLVLTATASTNDTSEPVEVMAQVF